MTEQLQEWLGPKCTGIKINGQNYHFLNQPQRQVKFCEAVHYSFKLPLQITNQTLGCPGARRSFGFDQPGAELTAMISENTGIPFDYVEDALDKIPVMDPAVENIVLGIPQDLEEEINPDLYISYTHPDNVMRLIHHLARYEIKPLISPYSIHSICGNVFAKAYHQQEVTVSFGCPESRNYGGVAPDQVIVGIPGALAKRFI